MTSRQGSRDDQGFVAAMRHLLYDHEPETPEEIDAFLRSEGLDPDAIGERGRVRAEQALAESPLDWRNRRVDLERAHAELSQEQISPDMSRPDLVSAIQQILAGLSPAQRAQASVQFRNLETVSDEDLRSLLRELRYLSGDR